MAGFFGGEEKDKNFVGKFLRHVRALLDLDKHSFAVGDRVWQPTWTIDLARNCLVLMGRGAGGLYTMSCRGEASFYDLARACIAEVGLADSVTIEPTTEARVAADQRATRPARAVMDNRRLRAEGLDRMRPWRAALADYLARPYFPRHVQGFSPMTLFDPFDAGPLGRLKNRIAMAPMTRGFAPDHHANAAMTAYYAKRAEDGVGLIFTEGTVIHHSGDGYRNVPHIETDSQAAAWKPVVDAVHAADTRIVCQLWHCGRISHPDFTGGLAPVSSTSRAAEGQNRQNDKALRRAARARARRDAGHLRAYADAAARAIAAGFDAVELHGANGYLIDEFLDGNVNDRRDAYGGSVEGRCRFLLECLETVIKRVGAGESLRAHQSGARHGRALRMAGPGRHVGPIWCPPWPGSGCACCR